MSVADGVNMGRDGLISANARYKSRIIEKEKSPSFLQKRSKKLPSINVLQFEQKEQL
jgi:hypothetical protein